MRPLFIATKARDTYEADDIGMVEVGEEFEFLYKFC